jgi:L-asparaginase
MIWANKDDAMMHFTHRLALAATLLCSAAVAQPVPHVRILGTGGTIAGSNTDNSSTSYRSGVVGVNDLVKALPGVDRIATISAEQVANVASGDMDEARWRTLLGRVEAAMADPGVSGVVITHGTDTLEETAYFLHLGAPRTKPIVMVGSMRPGTAVSADGPQNLMDAIRVATSPKSVGRGVMVVMNDTIFEPISVTKVDVRRVDAFAAPSRGPIGDVLRQEPAFLNAAAPLQPALALKPAPLPAVAIIYAHAGITGDDVHRMAGDARGVVIGGVGAGGISSNARDALRDLVKRGVAVVRTPRQGHGDIWANPRPAGTDDEGGPRTIAGRTLTPAKARILLMLALQEARTPDQLQAIFDQYGAPAL